MAFINGGGFITPPSKPEVVAGGDSDILLETLYKKTDLIDEDLIIIDEV